MAKVQVSEFLQDSEKAISLIEGCFEKLTYDGMKDVAKNILINARKHLEESVYEYLHCEEM